MQCLIDKERTEFLKQEISKTVKDGDIVVDAGTGTGILALFAADAGAKRVYAIEADKNLYFMLKNTLIQNDYSDKIVLIGGDASQVHLPEKVDVIIAEMVSTGLIDEYQIPVLNNLRKYLKKNGKLIPYKINNFVELVYSENYFYGHNLNIIKYEYPWHPELCSIVHTKKYLYKQIDFSKRTTERIIAKLIVKITEEGKINGVRISNETIFPDGAIFNSSEAYCMPLVLPIKEIIVKKGDRFLLRLSYLTCKGLETLKYSLKIVT